MVNSRIMGWEGLEAGMGEKYAYRVLVKKPEEKRPLGRPRRRWKYSIGMDLEEIGWGVWTGFIWLRTGNNGGVM
jgi:hypothetical protein